jgi:hypothetical protein
MSSHGLDKDHPVASQHVRLILVAFAVIAPTAAHAHGGQLLFLFLYFPHVVVFAALVFTMWKWRAPPAAKGVTTITVLITSAALFGANYAIQYGAIRFPFGNSAYLLVVVAQLAIPVAVGMACARFVTRRGPDPERDPDRE